MRLETLARFPAQDLIMLLNEAKIAKKLIISAISQVADYWAQFDWLFPRRRSTAMRAHLPP